MNEITFEGGATLAYEHIPVATSGNAFIGTRYRTNVYLVQNGHKYDMGWEEGKLDEEEIKLRFTELIKDGQQKQYGQQGTLLRRELPGRRAAQQAAYRARTLRTYG